MRKKSAGMRKPSEHRKSRWHSGYKFGLNDGYYMGQCESIIRETAPLNIPIREMSVLYVSSGKGFPYNPIDDAIIEALRGLVRELHLGDPTQDIAALSQQLRPNLVFVLDGMTLQVAQIDRIRELGILTALWLADDPYYTDVTIWIARHYDHVFTLELSCVEFYQQNGCAQVHYLPFGAQSSVYRPRQVGRHARRDIAFIGSGYWNRIAFFDQIAGPLASKDIRFTGIWWDRLQNYKRLASKIDLGKWLGPAETAEHYSGTKIVINLHRDPDDETYNHNTRKIGALSPNPRTFEISATGTLQLTDARADLERFYVPGHEIATYSSPEEMLHKLEHYLIHENERRAIALRGLRRTMSEHTYAHRLHQALTLIFGAL
ncbi:spore maturation protein cgeB [Paenibacillus swuensis]|uniref:Spore maturation protein cgeB n=1 Tax=Paenibacillus swuensis TaxID=1178515 RepID=A0A172TGB8_9BACL|nr:glycosyltransferase [Paenibacillus swuensis]ANE46099.1 spore maturation protein cgeB [Paenibacillus swuensis]